MDQLYRVDIMMAVIVGFIGFRYLMTLLGAFAVPGPDRSSSVANQDALWGSRVV